MRPRSLSTLMVDQTFAPVRSFQASPSQVSWPVSPGRGIVWNVQTDLPVRTSKARTLPLGPFDGNSGTIAHVITRSLYIAGADVTEYNAPGWSPSRPARKSSVPPCSNSVHGFPVFAPRAINLPSNVPYKILWS